MIFHIIIIIIIIIITINPTIANILITIVSNIITDGVVIIINKTNCWGRLIKKLAKLPGLFRFHCGWVLVFSAVNPIK